MSASRQGSWPPGHQSAPEIRKKTARSTAFVFSPARLRAPEWPRRARSREPQSIGRSRRGSTSVGTVQNQHRRLNPRSEALCWTQGRREQPACTERGVRGSANAPMQPARLQQSVLSAVAIERGDLAERLDGRAQRFQVSGRRQRLSRRFQKARSATLRSRRRRPARTTDSN